MNCRVCEKSENILCLCGFCMKCIARYGHHGCEIIAKDKEKRKELNKLK